jgi:hypothetical protein
MEPITVVGTESGTLVQSTTTNEGDEAITTTWVAGKLETNEIGTKTGELKLDGTKNQPESTTDGIYVVVETSSVNAIGALLQCKALTGTTM